MIKKLYPTQYIQSIYEIDLLQLKKMELGVLSLI